MKTRTQAIKSSAFARLTARIGSLVFLTGTLWVASLVVHGIVLDRLNYRENARSSIAQSFPGRQVALGPVLVIQYEERYTVEKTEGEGKNKKTLYIPTVKTMRHAILPDSLNIANAMKSEAKARGLFKVTTFGSAVDFSGQWQLPALTDLKPTEAKSTLHLLPSADVYISVADARGLSNIKVNLGAGSTATSTANEIATELDPSIRRMGGLPSARIGFNFDLKEQAFTARSPMKFNIAFSLSGTESLAFVPLGKENTIRVKSDWPHPSFEGALLPTEKQISKDGFDASWSISSISSEARERWLSASASDLDLQEPAQGKTHRGKVGAAASLDQNLESVGVRLIDPVDLYTLSDRATKYAMLFVLMTIGAFVLFELFKKLKIHPVQYLLVGVALVLFFLLLISLAERIGFSSAYLSAASGCVLLITYYAGYALRSWKRAVPLGFGLSALYGALFGILNSEQNALLMGSALLFFVVASLMIATRNTNWYELFTPPSADDVGAQESLIQDDALSQTPSR
jgi:inner membrane protein